MPNTEKDIAIAKATEMLEQLPVEIRQFFEISVWQNDKWCYEIQSQHFNMQIAKSDFSDVYLAFLSISSFGGHCICLGDVPEGPTPLDALKMAFKQLKVYLNKVNQLHKNISDCLGES